MGWEFAARRIGSMVGLMSLQGQAKPTSSVALALPPNGNAFDSCAFRRVKEVAWVDEILVGCYPHILIHSPHHHPPTHPDLAMVITRRPISSHILPAAFSRRWREFARPSETEQLSLQLAPAPRYIAQPLEMPGNQST